MDLDSLVKILKNTVSEKRFIHSLGVAQTTEMLLLHFQGATDRNYECSWNGFSAGTFCGFFHDFAREMTDSQILLYCKKNSIKLTSEELLSPVIAHGKVSAKMAEKLCPSYPESWKKAIISHTTGSGTMNSLSLALFIADYIEPSRTFMTDKERYTYFGKKNLKECAYSVLCSMIAHWQEKMYYNVSENSFAMKKTLEKDLKTV